MGDEKRDTVELSASGQHPACRPLMSDVVVAGGVYFRSIHGVRAHHAYVHTLHGLGALRASYDRCGRALRALCDEARTIFSGELAGMFLLFFS